MRIQLLLILVLSCAMSLIAGFPMKRAFLGQGFSQDSTITSRQFARPGLIFNSNTNTNDNNNYLQAFLNIYIQSLLQGFQSGFQSQNQFGIPTLPMLSFATNPATAAGAGIAGMNPFTFGTLAGPTPQTTGTVQSQPISTTTTQSITPTLTPEFFGTNAVINTNSNRNGNSDFVLASLFSSIFNELSGSQSAFQSQSQPGTKK